MGSIFLSYRSVDSPWGAAGIHDGLSLRIRGHRIFRDCVSLEAGSHYPTEIRAALEEAELLVAAIGPRWLAAADPETGERLIDREQDWVRRELVSAFTRGIPVLPVLLMNGSDVTRQPTLADLPGDVRRLATIQAFVVSQLRLGADLDQLAEKITGMLPARAAAASDRTIAGQIPRESFYSLVEALDAMPCMLNEDTRAVLVGQLRKDISGAVRYSSQRRTYAMNIVRTCLAYKGGLAEMIATIREIEGAESVSLQRLTTIARGLPPELRPDLQ